MKDSKGKPVRKFRGRQAARKLASAILVSLDNWPDKWGECTDGCDGIQFGTAPLEVTIWVRRVRMFDGVHVYYYGIEIWIPLLARLRLRRAVRYVLAKKAIREFQPE